MTQNPTTTWYAPEAPPDVPRRDVIAARHHTERAIDVMAAIMDDPDSGAANRLRAAKELLDRGWDAAAGIEDSDEQSYDEIIASLGPRDPATPRSL